MTKRQIIAMGGGGFSMEPDNPLLDRYVIEQSGKTKPRVIFIPTASGDSRDYCERFADAFEKLGCEARILCLYRGERNDLEAYLMEQDIIYVGGGNTRNLLVLWREWGLDVALRKAYEAGRVFAGISAGSICWFEQGLTDSVPNKLTALPCLGWLRGSNSPHYDGEAERRPSYQALIQSGEMMPGIACDDSVAAHYVNEQEHRFVSSVQGKLAFRVSAKQGVISEEAITPDFLG